jgi:light-regulated signal transduction histidine kinase (bacteriophytochrome)
MVRIAGFLIAILMVVLLIETGRAGRKARLATRAERTIQALNRELEAKVRQRTREVAERSQDLLTITDSVGHDLRNPLNAVSANLQLLGLQCSEALDEDGHNLLKQTEASLASTTEILDRLLELSSVFSSNFTTESIDMQKLVRETFDELLRHDPKPPAELVLGDLPEAHGEKILVRTLLMNLLGNALKYSRGEPLRRITVRARRHGDEVVYSISDNGVGFDDTAAERLFMAYERLEGNTEGLGLGLDIAARAVHRHRGRIWATGEPGVGASFYFTLSASPVYG